MKSSAPVSSALSEISATLSALERAYEIAVRVAEVGFRWPDWQGPLAKVEEEIDEVHGCLSAPAVDRAHLREEVGDLLLAVVELHRSLDVAPCISGHPHLESSQSLTADPLNAVRNATARVKAQLTRDQHEAAMQLGTLMSATFLCAEGLEIDPEEALSEACTKFAARFRWLEEEASRHGLVLLQLSQSDLLEIWQRAKSHTG